MFESPRPSKRVRLSPVENSGAISSSDDELLDPSSALSPSKRAGIHSVYTSPTKSHPAPTRKPIELDEDDLLLPTPKRASTEDFETKRAKSVPRKGYLATRNSATAKSSPNSSTAIKSKSNVKASRNGDGQSAMPLDGCDVVAEDREIRVSTPMVHIAAMNDPLHNTENDRDTPPARSSGRQRRPPRKYLAELEKSVRRGANTRETNGNDGTGELRGSAIRNIKQPPAPTSPSVRHDAVVAGTPSAPISAGRLTPAKSTVTKKIIKMDQIEQDTTPTKVVTPSKSIKRSNVNLSAIGQRIDDSPSARLSGTRRPAGDQSPSRKESRTMSGLVETDLSRDESHDEDDNDDDDGSWRESYNDEIRVTNALTKTLLMQEPQALQHPSASKLSRAISPPAEAGLCAAAKAHPTRFQMLKTIVLEKVTGRRKILSADHDNERIKVHTLLEQTIAAGESNSMLIIGARGSGKSALVQSVLHDLTSQYEANFHTIRLNGFIHTDDKLALREIWRQLGQEMDLDEEGTNKNYADTLSTLLALLSHLPENSDNVSGPVAKSVVFVIDEFDLFAAHARQTLLYNLFDIAQSRKAPIAVLGLTSRVDVVDSLEKRVKSRFSHRSVFLGLPKTLLGFQAVCKSALLISNEEMLQLATTRSAHAETLDEKSSTADQPSLQDLVTSWNASIETLLSDPDITTLISRTYHTNKSLPAALAHFLLPIASLTPSLPTPTPSLFTPSTSLDPPDSKLALLASLPALSLALLIAAARLDVILGADTCNFAMAYDEYAGLATKARVASASTALGLGIGGKVWGREAARAAWEALLAAELLLPVGAGGGAAGEMVRCDVALEEIAGAVPELERGLARWCREI